MNWIFEWLKAIFNRGPSAIDHQIKKYDEAEERPVHFTPNQEDSSFHELVKLSIQEENEELLRRKVALLYRLESVNGGIDPTEIQEDDFEYLYDEAIKWKLAHPLIGKSILSANERSHLKTTAKYPLFTDLVRKYPNIRAKFFHWILNDENSVVPFIEFPAASDRIFNSSLSGRISRHGLSVLRIMKEDGIKTLCLPFEGRFQSILNPRSTVSFRGNYVLTIAEIFAIFSRKDTEVGNLEFMRDGIVNWNIHHLGYWNADQNRYISIDISKEKWWNQMPVLEILNRRQLVKRYGTALKAGGWIAAAVATRGRPNLDFDATHAFLEVAVPLGMGSYSIFDFGKLATEYPSGILERLMMLTKTVHATIAYPDDNVFYTTRQRGFHPFSLSNRQGRSLMASIKEDIVTARANNFIYQIESENCAKWVYYKLVDVLGENNVPDLFRMQLLDTHPQGAVAHLFANIKKLPSDWQVPVLTFLHLPLGAARKIWIIEDGIRVAKSLSRHAFFNTGQIFLPALLIQKVIKLKFILYERIIQLIGIIKLNLSPEMIFFSKKDYRFMETPHDPGGKRLRFSPVL